jgi:hypothetical protein
MWEDEGWTIISAGVMITREYTLITYWISYYEPGEETLPIMDGVRSSSVGFF